MPAMTVRAFLLNHQPGRCPLNLGPDNALRRRGEVLSLDVPGKHARTHGDLRVDLQQVMSVPVMVP